MKRWLGPLVVLVLAAIGAHWATLQYAPSVIMDRALATLKERGIAEHAFTAPRRVTPDTQAVVRSSPDMFYSLCRYDLSDPGSVLKVSLGEWADYQSLSVFDARTNNFATFRGTGKSVTMWLVRPGSEDLGTNVVVSPTDRGVVLIRRLAPTPEAFEAAAKAAKADSCDPIIES